MGLRHFSHRGGLGYMAPSHFGASATGLSATDAGFVLPVIRVNLTELCRVPDQSPSNAKKPATVRACNRIGGPLVYAAKRCTRHGEACADDHQTKPSAILCLASIVLKGPERAPVGSPGSASLALSASVSPSVR